MDLESSKKNKGDEGRMSNGKLLSVAFSLSFRKERQRKDTEILFLKTRRRRRRIPLAFFRAFLVVIEGIFLYYYYYSNYSFFPSSFVNHVRAPRSSRQCREFGTYLASLSRPPSRQKGGSLCRSLWRAGQRERAPAAHLTDKQTRVRST